MKIVLESNNAIALDFAEALLKDAEIPCWRFDQQMSQTEGSLGILPRRLMVADEDFARADEIVREGLAAEIP
ncbi:MAG: DUF2007 domain-containing protein [Alphaproteobacteria bacterium]|nr:DUF2007 domain-containing protein [Alphaproteobacteria bacterium]MBV9694351.1 DUF2007 domain-containing protein [Alphaproteobacteria bacterium]